MKKQKIQSKKKQEQSKQVNKEVLIEVNDNDITQKDTIEIQDKKPKIGSGLKLQEEEFCQAYVSHDRDLYGNGVKCYLEVYGPDYLTTYKKYMSYRVAGVLAHRMLNKVKIINRINELLEKNGFNNENVDKQHLFLLNQHADLRTKLGAIKEYNELKGRIQKKIKLSGSLAFGDMGELSTEDLRKIIDGESTDN